MRASGGSARPSCPAIHVRAEDDRESANSMTAAASQLTEYSTRICERLTEKSTKAIRRTLRTVVTLSRRSIALFPSSAFLSSAAFKLQDVDEHSQQDVEDVI